VLARERGVQTQQGDASLLDRSEVGHDLLQLVVDVFGIELGFIGGAGQGLDEGGPGREVPAGGDGPPDHRGAVPYRGDLGQLLVVGLVQHPLLERVQSFVQLEDKRGELGVKRADHRVQRPDRVASELGLDRTCLPHGLKGGAGRATQRDQESGGVVAVHLDWLAELLIEAEADKHGSLAVNPQLGTLAKLLRVPGRQRRQPQAAGELVNYLVGGVLDVQPEGLACVNELCYQRRGGIPDNLAVVVNPAPHGGLPDSFSAYRAAGAAEAFPGNDDPGHHRKNAGHDQ
jgi:hypothetical protein